MAKAGDQGEIGDRRGSQPTCLVIENSYFLIFVFVA
jgi:hypothetical protein